MRLKEEKVRIIIEEVINGQPVPPDTSLYESMYWDGYLNALRRVVKMPPDDEVSPDEDYD